MASGAVAVVQGDLRAPRQRRNGVARRKLGHRRDRTAKRSRNARGESGSISSCSARKRQSPPASAIDCARPASACSARIAPAGARIEQDVLPSVSWSATVFRRARARVVHSLAGARKALDEWQRRLRRQSRRFGRRQGRRRYARRRRARRPLWSEWFGSAGIPGGGTDLLLEEVAQGREVSVFAIGDGRAMVPVAAACDYKRAGDGDTGPNTGGMGAYSPPPGFPTISTRSCARRILAPVLRGLLAEGEAYIGVLYCGLMWTHDGPVGDRVQRALRRSGDAEC